MPNSSQKRTAICVELRLLAERLHAEWLKSVEATEKAHNKRNLDLSQYTVDAGRFVLDAIRCKALPTDAAAVVSAALGGKIPPAVQRNDDNRKSLDQDANAAFLAVSQHWLWKRHPQLRPRWRKGQHGYGYSDAMRLLADEIAAGNKPAKPMTPLQKLRDKRDEWVYKCVMRGDVLSEIVAELNVKRSDKRYAKWPALGGEQAVRGAAISYARRHGKDTPPARSRGARPRRR